MVEIQDETLYIEEDTLKGKYLTFPVGKETYAIEIMFVNEIISIQTITEVPELPAYVKGIINLRGKIIPVMDVRLRFKMKSVEYNNRTCIIIIEIKDVSVGLIVDNVSEVMSIADEDIVSPPEMNKGADNVYIKAIGKVGNDVKLILECEKLINDNDFETISQLT